MPRNIDPISYSRVKWQDGSNGGTPLDSTHLNIMEEGIIQATSKINSVDRELYSLAEKLDAFESATSDNFSEVRSDIQDVNDELDSEVHRLDQEIATKETIANVNVVRGNLSNAINEFRGADTNLSNRIDGAQSEMNTFKSDTESNFVNVNSSISGVDTKFTAHVNNIFKDLGTKETIANVNQIRTDVGNLTTNLATANDRIDDNAANITTNSERIDNLFSLIDGGEID